MNPSIFHQNAWRSHNTSVPGLNLRLLVLSVVWHTGISSGDSGRQAIGRKVEALPVTGPPLYLFSYRFQYPIGNSKWLTRMVDRYGAQC